jgi:hypothetical protein
MYIEERKTMAIYTGKYILKNFAENLEVILRKNQIILFSFFVATLFAFPHGVIVFCYFSCSVCRRRAFLTSFHLRYGNKF